MAKKGGATLAEDAPWRVSSGRPVPKISRSPVLSISQNPETDYAISVMKVVCFADCNQIWEFSQFFLIMGLRVISAASESCGRWVCDGSCT